MGGQALVSVGLGSATPLGPHFLTSLPRGLSAPPQMQPGPRVLKVLAGEILDLNCMAEGSPEPQLSWSKDGVALQGGGPEGSIHFSAIRTHDAGWYRCEASNSAGVDAWELELQVLGASPWNPGAHRSLPPLTAAWATEMLAPSFLRPPAPEAVGAVPREGASWVPCPLGWKKGPQGRESKVQPGTSTL